MSWPLRKLEALCHVVTKGTTPTSIGYDFAESGIPFLRIQNLFDSTVSLDDVLYISSETHEALKRSIIRPGDFLITIAGTIGRVAIVPADFPESNCNQAIAILRFDTDKLWPTYLLHWITTQDAMSQISGKKVTATISNLSLGQIKELEIPLPPLEEQKRIAAILDKADAIRRKRQQAIKLADDFLRSVFLEMFGDPVTNPKGWERCKFEDLTDMVTYGLTVRPEYIDDGIPLISAKEIRSGTINLEICSRISEADLDALSSKARPNYGDILFSKTGSIGHCALVDTVEPFAITQNAARVVPNSKRCVSHFLLGLLRTKYFYNLANKEAKGNAVKDLQLGVMKSFLVYAPPLELQKKYSEIFQKFTGQSLLQEEALRQAAKSFNSLNQKAFLGEL